jgi:hypothetical protein
LACNEYPTRFRILNQLLNELDWVTLLKHLNQSFHKKNLKKFQKTLQGVVLHQGYGLEHWGVAITAAR